MVNPQRSLLSVDMSSCLAGGNVTPSSLQMSQRILLHRIAAVRSRLFFITARHKDAALVSI